MIHFHIARSFTLYGTSNITEVDRLLDAQTVQNEGDHQYEHFVHT